MRRLDCIHPQLAHLNHVQSSKLERSEKQEHFGKFGGHINTINTSMQSGWLRMRLNISTRVLAKVAMFWPGRRINRFEVAVKDDDDFG
jgi:hypothetical protein